MDYATHYDIGDRRRDERTNEDSVAISVFEQGHRDGFRGSEPPADAEATGVADSDAGTDSEEDSSGADDVTDPATGARDPPRNRSAAVFALGDGAGGHEAGDAASYIATTVACEHLAPVAVRAARSDAGGFGLSIEAALPDRPSDGDLESAVAEAVVAAHREVLAYAAENDEQAHTTIVAGICVNERLHYGWVGDSRAYVLNAAREESVRLTSDHAVVERLSDAGRIDDVEALVHPRGNEITRALGGSGREDPETATVAVETGTVPLYAEDVVLVTSDGLVDAQTDAPTLHERYLASGRDQAVADRIRHRAVTDADILDCVLGAPSLADAAAELVALANDRGGKDNLSTILLHDGDLPETPADPPARGVDAEPPAEDRETVLGSGE